MEDNIWTLDGDGELRLSLLAMAQEEKTCLLGHLHRLLPRVNIIT